MPEDQNEHIDQDFEGSIFQQIGLTAKLCPHCRAHLPESGHCLNLCTMPTHLSRKFNAMLAQCHNRATANPTNEE